MKQLERSKTSNVRQSELRRFLNCSVPPTSHIFLLSSSCFSVHTGFFKMCYYYQTSGINPLWPLRWALTSPQWTLKRSNKKQMKGKFTFEPCNKRFRCRKNLVNILPISEKLIPYVFQVGGQQSLLDWYKTPRYQYKVLGRQILYWNVLQYR